MFKIFMCCNIISYSQACSLVMCLRRTNLNEVGSTSMFVTIYIYTPSDLLVGWASVFDIEPVDQLKIVDMIRVQARALSTVSGFKASRGWLGKFMKGHSSLVVKRLYVKSSKQYSKSFWFLVN